MPTESQFVDDMVSVVGAEAVANLHRVIPPLPVLVDIFGALNWGIMYISWTAIAPSNPLRTPQSALEAYPPS